jgi:16S rRNA (guanine527-N7)-methyltransferase
MKLSAAQIDKELVAYLPSRIDGLADKINVYIDILLRWNKKISLTTVTDPVEIVRFHFGESLFALPLLRSEKSRLADVGSGAGFPGLPLAIALPSMQVIVIDSNLKKCAFLAEVIRAVEVKNASVFQGRMESMGSEIPSFDFIVARAFGHFEKLLTWSHNRISRAGKVLLWLGEADSRQVSSREGWSWEVPLLIPGSSRRVLMSGTPTD